MTNHVHLILIPGSAESLALTLGQLHSQYALEQNRQRRRVGHLWQNRFFSCALEAASCTCRNDSFGWGLALVQCTRAYLSGGAARITGLAVDRLDGGNAAGPLRRDGSGR